MAVYGFKDNKCKDRIAKIYGDVTDEFGTSATVATPTGIASVGNNMESNSIAFYHVNNSGFPGSGEGTLTAFKTKGGTYKNYMFFDTVNDDFYFLAADGTGKSWTKCITRQTTYTGAATIEASGSEYIELTSANFASRPLITGVEVQAFRSSGATGIAVPVAWNWFVGDNNVGIGIYVYNLDSTYNAKVTVKLGVLE